MLIKIQYSHNNYKVLLTPFFPFGFKIIFHNLTSIKSNKNVHWGFILLHCHRYAIAKSIKKMTDLL